MNPSSPNEQTAPPHRSGSIPPGWVKLATFGNANEAELFAAVLADEGIQTQVFGANINAMDWFWQVFNDVDLIVRDADFEPARKALSLRSADDVEPAEEPHGGAPSADEKGRALVPVAAFEHARDLRDAQTVLASERIAAYGPRLVLRGDRPAGRGKRFVLRVAETDAEAARSLLAEEAADDRDQPRCPRCGSWQVNPRKGFLMGLAGVVGLGGEAGEVECHSCHYRGPSADFLARVDH